MPMFIWILVWAVIIGTVAFFAVREVRRGRHGPVDFDRTNHEAVREAASQEGLRGPNGFGQTYLGN